MQAVHKPLYMEFVACLRNARKAKRLSQRALGKLLRKPQSYVAKVETCERRLDLIETAEWCLALQVSLDSVLPVKLRSLLLKSKRSRSKQLTSEDSDV